MQQKEQPKSNESDAKTARASTDDMKEPISTATQSEEIAPRELPEFESPEIPKAPLQLKDQPEINLLDGM